MMILFKKGKTVETSNENKRVRFTALLDDKTLSMIREFGFKKNGTTNVSKAIMLMVKEHNEITKKLYKE